MIKNACCELCGRSETRPSPLRYCKACTAYLVQQECLGIRIRTEERIRRHGEQDKARVV